MFKDVAFLISTEKTMDEAGDTVETTKEKMIYCNIKSIGQSEFYQAMALGLKLEIKIHMMNFEYNNEKTIKLNGTIYEVIRTFANGTSDTIEIALGGGINGTT